MPRTMGCSTVALSAPQKTDGAILPLTSGKRTAEKRRQKPKPTAVKQQQTVGFFSVSVYVCMFVVDGRDMGHNA